MIRRLQDCPSKQPCKNGSTIRVQVDGGVGEFLRGNNIPEIEIIPLVCLAFLSEQPAVSVVCPAGIIKIIANITVFALADKHRLIDQQNRGRASHPQSSVKDIESQVIFAELGGLEVVEASICGQVAQFSGDHGGDVLVDSGRRPQQTINLQADEVSQIAALADQGLREE